MLSIPIRQVPSQSTKVSLSGQNCIILISHKPQGVFVSVKSNGVDVVSSVIARNAVPLVCIGYTGFIGNLLFIDNVGRLDPSYSGFSTRFELVYLTAEEYEIFQQ
jgi:hypothetical protein